MDKRREKLEVRNWKLEVRILKTLKNQLLVFSYQRSLPTDN